MYADMYSYVYKISILSNDVFGVSLTWVSKYVDGHTVFYVLLIYIKLWIKWHQLNCEKIFSLSKLSTLSLEMNGYEFKLDYIIIYMFKESYCTSLSVCITPNGKVCVQWLIF